jgi:CMP-2-keto-3-deoxyoctulosonic acid synthetase
MYPLNFSSFLTSNAKILLFQRAHFSEIRQNTQKKKAAYPLIGLYSFRALRFILLFSFVLHRFSIRPSPIGA